MPNGNNYLSWCFHIFLNHELAKETLYLNLQKASNKKVKKMSKEMREYLNFVVSKHGFETRMLLPCGSCGENADLGASYIVAKEDIEHNKDFEKFRSYRQLQEGGTHAYRRSSKLSLNESSQSLNLKKKTKKMLNTVGFKMTNVDTRSFIEKLRDFIDNRYLYSLYIFHPKSRYQIFKMIT